MYKIITKTRLAASINRLDVQAPEIAGRARPGQFVVLRVNDTGERIPLTVAGQDPAGGTISLIFQETGKTTRALAQLSAGDSIRDILGPLGTPTKIEHIGNVVVIGGGVGAAEVLPVAKAFKAAGNTVTGIVGARSRELIILENELKAACDKLYITTDDGSSGRKGFVSDVLKEIIAGNAAIGLVYAVGPVPMMRVVANITREAGIKTTVSLNPIMLDGTGMCGVCRVRVGDMVKFACVDGPEFDAHQVQWDELISRLAGFRQEEKISVEQHAPGCTCKKE
ncbi:MAG: ferredoxin-NADP reductase [Elusimicrobia bacterium RIFOXYA2_FULL_50_26]|nr:MAG: ferredoxin-NADP reductase [Elusimicrobia bacterium RIFOXYA2_FULL_50_26]